MANASDKTAVMTKNFKDMGLNNETICKCLTLLNKKKYLELEKFLKSYRHILLDSIYKYNDRIGCLDYFTCTLKKTEVF